MEGTKHDPNKKGIPNPDLILLQQEAQERGASPEEAFRMLQNPLKGRVRDQLVEEQGDYVPTVCAESLARMYRLAFPPLLLSTS